jgi:hypothetical protein
LEKFEVGKEFPLKSYKNFSDFGLIEVNSSLFDFIIGMVKPTSKEKMTIRREPLRYGCYYENYVPFLIIDFRFQNINFDATINIFKIDQNSVEEWLNTEANSVNLFLIDTATNIIEGIRLIGLDMNFVKELKDNLRKQLLLSNKEEVEKTIDDVYRKYSTQDLINKIKMINI